MKDTYIFIIGFIIIAIVALYFFTKGKGKEIIKTDTKGNSSETGNSPVSVSVSGTGSGATKTINGVSYDLGAYISYRSAQDTLKFNPIDVPKYVQEFQNY